VTIDVDPIDEPLPRFVDGLRCFPFSISVNGVKRRTELRVPPELLIEPHWSDAMRHVYQFVRPGSSDCGCGG